MHRFPLRALLLLCTDFMPPGDLLARLHWWQRHSAGEALTCCSNSAAAFNPFGFNGELAEPPTSADLDALVANSSKQPLLQAPQWPQHLLWLSHKSVQTLQQQAQEWSQRSPLACGIRLLIADDMFCRDRKRSLFTTRPDYLWDLPPAEAIEYRAQNLHTLLQQQQLALPRLQHDAENVTLHISHCWGGGVQHWVDNYCQADTEHPQLVLKSQGFWKHKTYGSCFTLHQGGTDGAELQNWYLVPAIGSTSIRHRQYEQMLDEICQRYRVQRIIVSSLIGHSLDVLRCGIPIIAVIHDYYPAWPLLSLPPGDLPVSQSLQQQLQQLQQQPHNLSGDDLLLFNDRDARGWHTLTLAWQQLLQQAHVALVAPSRAARQQLLQLVPALADSEQLQLQVIEHGFRGWQSDPAAAPVSTNQTDRNASEGDISRRLRLVLVGRLASGKGLELLHQAWPLIRDHVQLTLLGCGRNGRSMLGQAQLDVISDYAWQQLPQIIHQIQPHAALLLSTVSETYSYTLTEMLALQVPVIATRRGSFSERIEHGSNGLLIEPEPVALQQAIMQLRQQPQLLARLQRGAASIALVSLPTMLAGYDRLLRQLRQHCSTAMLQPPRRLQAPDLQAAQALHLARENLWQQAELDQRQQQLSRQTEELGKRAGAMQRQRRALDQQQQQLQQVRELLQSTQKKISQLQQQMQQQRAQYDQQLQQQQYYLDALEQQRAQMLASRSWRITLPLRVLSRLVANFRQQRAWNPLRWPQLLRSFIKLALSNGLLPTLRQLQSPGQSTTPAPIAQADIDSSPTAAASRHHPLQWQSTTTESAASILVLMLLPKEHDERPDVNGDHVADCVLAMLHRLQQALHAYRSEVHIVAANVETLLTGCTGLHQHTELASALAAMRPAAERSSQLLLINNLLQLRAETLPQLLLAGPSGHSMICASYGDDDSTETTTPHPQQAVSGEVFAFSTDLLLLSPALLPALLHYCSAPTSLPDSMDAALLALAERQLKRTGKGVWRQSLSRYRHDRVPPRPLLHLSSPRPSCPAGCILVVDVWVPMPDKDSGSLRMVNLLKLLLELGWRVVFVPRNLGHAGHYTEQLQRLGVEVWYQPFIGSWKQFLQQHGREFNIVMLSRLNVASELLRRIRRHCRNASIIYDTVDLHYLREQRQAELQNSLALRRLAAQTRHQELTLMQQADMTLVVSAAEQQLLSSELPHIDIRIVSNIHDIAGCQAPFESRSGVLFVGGFQHPPNIDAAAWLAEAIWPLVTARLPHIKLHLIGSNVTEKIQVLAADSIIVHGYVAELEPWLDQVRCTVAPLRYGAGIKGKVNSSMSRGVPVVATSIAAEGMFLSAGHDVLLADSSNAFADAICQLHEDASLWQKLSQNAISNVEKFFSMQRARQDLQVILDTLQQAGKQPEHCFKTPDIRD